MSGVVGQNITPKDDVSNSNGLKSGFNSAFIGDQKAKKTKGKTQYLQVGSLSKTNSLRGLMVSHIQNRLTIKIGTRLPVNTTIP